MADPAASLPRPVANAAWAVLAAAHVLLAWFFPGWLAPFALVWIAAAAWLPGLRAAFTARALLAIAGLLAVLALKDLSPGGPFAEALSRLDPASLPPEARQPDRPRLLVSLGRLAAVLLALPLLRVLLDCPRRARAVALGLCLATAGLAASLLTHPAGPSEYGRAFHLGEVVNRNPAAGAFALAALFALGAGLSAGRGGRRSALPAFAAAGLCAAAVVTLGSRGGLLALAAGAGFLLYRENRDKPLRAAALAAGPALLLALLSPFFLARFAEGEGYRFELAAASLRALAHAPLAGLGLGGFAPGFALFGGLVPAEGMRVAHPDCGWILLLVEWGPLGLIAATPAAFVLLGRAAAPEDDSPALVAAAGLAAWSVAALGDVSLHRPEILVLGLPLLALFRPPASAPEDPRAPRAAPLLAGLLAASALAALLLGEACIRAALDPSETSAAAASALPLDPRARHLAGNRALARGEIERAAAEYSVAAALDPANSVAIQAYARAIGASRPDLAKPLWRRLFAGATLRAPALLAEELAGPFPQDAAYWVDALSVAPALWVLPADTGLRGAQGAYERWRALPAAVRAGSPWRSVLGASARWASAREFEDWPRAVEPEPAIAAAAEGGELLLSRSRDDLAWIWLVRRLPPPALASGPHDPTLPALVRAHPDDVVAAARLLGQTASAEERIALLQAWVRRPGSPPAFRIRLAHELDAAGRRREALPLLRSAAADLARGG